MRGQEARTAWPTKKTPKLLPAPKLVHCADNDRDCGAAMPRKTPKSEAGQPPAAPVGPAVPPEAAKGVSVGHPHAHLPHFQGLLQKIKQRNVGRVAILYIVVSYLILEPFEMFFHLLDLPVWTGRTAVALVVLGFPVALLLAWVYEITPTGIKPSTDVDPQQSIARHTGRKLDRAIIAVLAVALVYFVADKFWISKRVAVMTPTATVAPAAFSASATLVIPEKSVAVLPFVDMSEKKDQEYFSDGLAEELIDHLAHAADLKVIARTSSFQFKGKNEDMRSIGQKLGVANLLEGSVRTSGNTLRVTAQLINVMDGTHRWSETYDRKMGDIFKIQDEIAAAVVAALKATMASMPTRANAYSDNVESYNEVLRGRYFLGRGTKEDSEKAMSAFRQSIELYPENADAWLGLANSYNMRGIFGWTPPAEAYREGRKAIDRALAINPNLAWAHHALGILELNYNFNFEAYNRENHLSVELDPSLAARTLDEGIFAFGAGEPAKAVQLFRRAKEVDPLDSHTLEWLATALYAANDLAEAERVNREMLEINPNRAGVYCNLGQLLLAQHQPDAALATMAKERDERSRLTCMPQPLWVLGRRAEADALLVQAQTTFPNSMAYPIAEAYAMRNDKDAAFQWLNRAYENREPQITVVKGDPDFRSLRNDSRFGALLRKLKLPE
jgi:adenylate cyclase